MMKTLLKTLKLENLRLTSFETRRNAEQANGCSIDGFYNPIRRHSALNSTSPSKFKKIAKD